MPRGRRPQRNSQSSIVRGRAPAEPGRYRFYCGSPGHAAAGMVGVLVVEP